VPTVLLIDDHQDTLDVTVLLLEEAGFEVLAARDCMKGLELVLQRSPPVVLLDLNVAGSELDPLMFAEMVRKYSPRTRIVLVSGAEGLLETAHALTADGHIAKPYHPAKLIRLLHQTMKASD
jgi:chemosensory pili system protein ChpA (sensor histidine kinase/response regulator)